MKQTVEISIVIPIYNEMSVLDELYKRLVTVLDKTKKSYELIFVEDGSKDESFKKLKYIQLRDDNVKLIRLRGNFGQTAALSAGFDNAEGDTIIAMDGDLQHMPEDIPKFIKKIGEGYDIVSGWRENRKDPYFSRRLPSKIANWIMARISGIQLHDFGTTFKAYKREIIKDIRLYGQFHRFIPVLAGSMKASIIEIPIENIRQAHRKSHYNISRTFTVFFDLIRLHFFSKYLSRPLQVFGTFGIFLCLIGGCINVYLIYMKYVHNLGLMTYRAPLFILGVLLLILAFLFIFLGLLGEILFKLFNDINKTKIYSIKEIHTNKEVSFSEKA